MFRSALKETPIKQRRPIRVNVETGVMPCCNRCSPDFVYDKIVSSRFLYKNLFEAGLTFASFTVFKKMFS